MFRLLDVVVMVGAVLCCTRAMPVERQLELQSHLNSTEHQHDPGLFSLQGVDVSQPTSLTDFKCLKSSGHKFAIVRAYQSIGEPDHNAPATVSNAWAAGFEHVDVYLFPCIRCGNAAGQVKSMVSYLKSKGTRYGMIWLDVEGVWGSQSENRAFFEELAEASKSEKSTGVYTSKYQWSTIMGDYDGGSKFPLWYPHYDNNPSFSDFEAFGGWSKPALKQYEGDKYLCNAGVDLNYEPGI